MKNYVLSLLVLVGMATGVGYGQNDCPGTISLCVNSENILDFNGPAGIYGLTFYGNNGTVFYNTINYTGGVFWYYITDLGASGSYVLEYEGQIICEGQYTAFSPISIVHQSQTSGNSLCYNFDELDIPVCSDSTQVSFDIIPVFCIGEEGSFRLSNNREPSGFNLGDVTKLNFDGGELIKFDKDNFTIKWTQAGFHCISYRSGTELCGGIDYFTVFVQDRRKLIIENTTPSPDNKYCIGQKIHLQNKPFASPSTLDQQKFEWKLSDGRIFYSSDLNINLVQDGELTVILTEISACKCSEPDTIKLQVGLGTRPTIECVGSVCVGDEVYYNTKEVCTTYIWSVSSHGVIVEGGNPTDSYIKIKWTQGGAAKLGLSLPSCNSSFCSNSHEEVIEVLSPVVDIQGPIYVCSPSSVYSIPAFAGTSINWSIPDGRGYISSGQGTNSVVVTWNGASQDFDSKITVSVTDCNSACNGNGELAIEYRAPDAIKSSKTQFCINEIASLWSEKGRKYDWTITAPDGTSNNYTQVNVVNLPMALTGEWKVIALDPTGCLNASNFKLKVSKVELTSIPLTFEQPCKDSITFLTFPNLDQNYIVNWTIFDGNLSFPAVQTTSRQTSYVWKTNGPYRVKYSIKDIYTSCVSDEIISSPSSTINIVGDANACIFESSKYDIDGTSKTLNWSIMPPDAGQILNITKDSVNVKWLKTGTHQLRGQGCNVASVLNVKVNAQPIITLNYPSPICRGTQAAVNVTIDQPGTIKILDSLRNLVSTQQTANVPVGNYYIEAISNNGCESKSEFKIVEDRTFDVYISSPDPNAYCVISSPITIVSEHFPAGSTYQWYKNGSIIPGATNPIVTVNDFGTYQIKVTSPSMCSVLSNPYNIVKDCGGGGGAAVCGIRNIISLVCDDQKFEVEQPYISTDFTWIFLDPFSTNNNTNGLSATHTFSKAGYYDVTAFGDANEIGRFKVKIPIVAEFEWKQDCASNEIKFTDISSYIDPSTVDKYVWDFGDPSSGANNTSNAQNPTHTYLSPGSYLVKLQVTDLGGCYTEFEEMIKVESLRFIDFTIKDSICIGSPIVFEPIGADKNERVKWEIKDLASGSVFTFDTEKLEYIFAQKGDYKIDLTIVDKDGCSIFASKTIKVVLHNATLAITTATAMPKCPTDIATLTGPLGNYSYKWQDGSTNSTINVIPENLYKLTVTDLAGCTFTPSIHVTNHIMSQSKIEGLYDYNSNIGEFTSRSFDSISICQNESFQLVTATIPNTVVTWPPYSSATATSGRYLFSAKIKSTIANCEVEIGPFVVNVKPRPVVPLLDAGSNQCIENSKMISVKNFYADHSYQWSNGQKGSSITAYSGGTYSVVVTKNGCSNMSSAILHEPPSTDFWASGCKEVCLPYQQCINLSSSSNKYYLIENGGAENLITNLSYVDISKVGDYQIKAVGVFGCIDTSDVLSISAKHDDHSIEGIIFHDINENGLFDGLDTLVRGINVGLYHGNSLVENDANTLDGQYLFDSVTISNLTVKLIGNTFGYQPMVGIDSLVKYSRCVEDKEHNIPLIYRCLSSREVNSWLICEGDSVIINNIVIKTNRFDSLTLTNAQGCDSVLVYNVAVYKNPIATISVDPPCINASNGSATILDFDLSENTYTYNNGILITSNVIDGLGEGSFLISVENNAGCKSQIPFSVVSLPKPNVDIVAKPSCPDQINGSINIMTNAQLMFSIDNGNIVNGVNTFDQLSLGNHILVAIDNKGCRYDFPFVIDTVNYTKTTLSTINTCPNAPTGMISVVNNGATYAFNNTINYTTQTVFPFLEAGNHFVSVKTIDGCIYSIPALIMADPNPNITISTKPSCVADSSGSISLVNNSSYTNMRFSLDSLTFTPTPTLTDIPSGLHTLYVKPSNGCIYSYPFDIKAIPSPSINTSTSNACENIANGRIELKNYNPLFTYKIDNVIISTNLVDSLAAKTYQLTVVDTFGCEMKTSVVIDKFPSLDVEYPMVEVDCSTENILILPEVKEYAGTLQYLWSNGATSPSITVNTSGQYSVNITDLCNRSNKVWDIEIEEPTDVSKIIFNPNIFSISAKSSDNRCFKMTKNPTIDVITFDMSVYDRWGNLVYKTNDLNACWDGTFNGRTAEKGVYVYLINYTYSDCQKIHGAKKYGDVTLLD